MAITLKNEQVWLSVPCGKHNGQAVVEGSFALEEELERIVALDAVPVLESVEVEEEKVIIRGSMNIDLLYQPTDSWGGVALVAKRWLNCLPFEQELEASGAKSGMTANARLAVEGSRYEGFGKELDYSAVVSIEVKLSEQKKIALATDALSVPPGQLSLEKKIVSYTVPLENIKQEAAVDGVLILPPELPDLGEIVQGKADARATNLNLNFGEGQAEISGCMDLSLLYYTASPEGVPPQLGSVQMHGVLPFDISVSIPALGEKARGKVKLRVSDFQLTPQAPREVAVNLKLDVNLDLFEQRKLRLLTDLSSKGDLVVAQRKETFQHEVLIGENTNEFSVQGGLILPAGELPIAQVLRLVPFISSQEERIVEERVVVEAQVGFDLFYLVDDTTVDSPFRKVTWSDVLHIEQMVPISGAEEGMEAVCQLELTDLAWELLDPASMRVQLRGRVQARVSAVEELELVAEATDVTKLDEDISMIYYIVQPGDTPWKVASRYGQSVDSLLAANEAVNFTPGSHLLILNGTG